MKLSYSKKKWAYDMWCLGYTQNQIAEALNVCEATIQRALKDKPRIRPILIYKGGDNNA
jgi:DNA-binding transcriptional regulator LsrR (DeoR family)